MRKIHYISGVLLSFFIFLHLINHTASIISVKSHISLMEQLRFFYRNIFIEALLLLGVFLQIFSGVKLYFRQKEFANTFFHKLHLYSGLYLAFFLIIHVGAVSAGRFILQLDTNFYFGVAGLNTFPFNLFFIPYYSLAICMLFSHFASIHNIKMKKEVLGISVTSQSYIILSLGVVWTLIILYGLTGKLNGVDVPVEYNVLVGR